ncbi:MAG: hypothetical protein IPJ18_19840 [Betaproteobacteria bacterium]|nr:hypothetical protein [Betaproteobacteria bacterium]
MVPPFGLAGSNPHRYQQFCTGGRRLGDFRNAAGTRTLSGTISETGGARNLTLNASSSADNRFVISGNNTYSGTTTIVDNSGGAAYWRQQYCVWKRGHRP